MLKNLKNKLAGIKKFRPSKLNVSITAAAVVLNAVLIGLMFWKDTYHANQAFLRANVLQLLVICLGSIVLFYVSYKEHAKKRAPWSMLFAFVLMLGVTLWVLSGTVYLFETLLGKAHFGTANVLFVNFGMIIFGLILSRFDVPMIDSGKKLYLAIVEHVKKNLGPIFFLFFLVAWIGVLNGAFVYVIALIPLLFNLYIFKVLLSSLRR
jgi:hypothetical protein